MSDENPEGAPGQETQAQDGVRAGLERAHVSTLGVYGLAVAGASAGVIAGAASGLIDGLWSLSATSQFLASMPERMAFLCFLATGYAFAMGLVGVPLAWAWGLYARASYLGWLWRVARERREAVRAEEPRRALAGLALIAAVIPCVAVALFSAYRMGAPVLEARKHIGLVIAAAMAIALVAALVGALVGVLLAGLLERGLVRLARDDRVARALSSGRASWFATLFSLAAVLAAFAYAARDTLALLHLRHVWVALLALVFVLLSTASLGGSLARRVARRRPLVRRVLPALSIALLGLSFVWLGSSDGVRKAARAYSGLGAHIPGPMRALWDLDGDGYSSILGGGDCDDWDAHVHPGAEEIPDDGVDQNCVGGDPSSRRSTEDVAFTQVPASVPANFNVLLITIDTVRADHVSAYGYERETTPALDRLAGEGALFTNAWAHAPSTRYSIPAILTGRYPLSVAYDTSIPGWPGLAPRNTTIAEILAAAGMHTGALLNYWYFNKERRMDQGFELYDNRNQRLHKQVSGKGPAQTKGSSSKEQTDAALAFVKEHAHERFFLWVHYYDPHFEYERHPGTPGFGSAPVDLYDHELRFTDHHIGRLLDDLRRRGLYQRTVVVVTGDHGEGFGEHGVDLHGYHLYAAQTKVPLIIRVPGLEPRRIETPVAHIDILPTLANLVGARPDPMMMGRSLLDMLAGERAGDLDRYVFQQLSYENNNEMRAAASKACHVIYNVSPDTSWELYQIDEDPMETRDIINRPSAACEDARAALEWWYDRSELPLGAADALLPGRPAFDESEVVELGDAVRLLSVDTPDQPLAPGQGFEVVYTFEARGPLRGGWKVFAHFEGPGRHRFLGDHAPPRPFSWWREGQFIRYAHTVTVPSSAASGVYQLWVGLFRGADRQPASGRSAQIVEDRVLVGSLRVER